jgi:hypothetical protein
VRDAYRNSSLLESLRREFLDAMDVAATHRSRRDLERVVPLVDPRRESGLESLSYGHMVVAGLPLPELQVAILTPEGVVFPDFLWAGQRVIGEADGLLKYDDREALVREKLRQELLEALGFRVIRWTWQEMRTRPARVLARIAAALD